jgi:N6-L-threonylcarbamoyladenine synthase
MILALESSCDETGVALFDPARGLVGEWTHTQIALHARHGGVVPDLATREHLRHLAPLLERARDASDNFSRVTRVAVTHGPGLAGCLALGVAAAKALALALRVPLAGVNHLRGHAFSPFVALHAGSPDNLRDRITALLPHLGLIVSGGNTLLFSLDETLTLRVLATTRDDAAGEALDKGAKLLGLGYPGGPLVEKLAATGRADAFAFPRHAGPRDALDFSFSGLKTSLRYQLEKMPAADIAARTPDLCASYQSAVFSAIAHRVDATLAQGNFCSVGLSGGVAKNRTLRAELAAIARRFRLPMLAAAPEHTGDNAAMIAFAAWADPTCSGTLPPSALRIAPSLTLA